jgi:hypothetical protein
MCTYTQTVLDGGYAPNFQIIASDAPNDPIVANTANSVWTTTMRKIVICQADEEERQRIQKEDDQLAAEKKALQVAAVSAAADGSAAAAAAAENGTEDESEDGGGKTGKGKKSKTSMKKVVASPFRKTNSRITVPTGNLRFGLSVPQVLLMLEGMDDMKFINKGYKIGLLRRGKKRKVAPSEEQGDKQAQPQHKHDRFTNKHGGSL